MLLQFLPMILVMTMRMRILMMTTILVMMLRNRICSIMTILTASAVRFGSEHCRERWRSNTMGSLHSSSCLLYCYTASNQRQSQYQFFRD